MANDSTSKFIDPEKTSVGELAKMLGKNFCIASTLFLLFSMVFLMIFGDDQMKSSMLYCWTIEGVFLIAAILQIVFFTPACIKKMSYGARVAAFGICLFVPLAIIAAVFDWFPADNTLAWVSFAITYIVILVAMTVIFTLIYRRKIAKLNEGLARFKAER